MKMQLGVIAVLLCGNIGLDKQVAAMQFSYNPQEEFAFDEHTNSAALLSGFMEMTWLKSITRTWKAFYFARLTMFTVAHGHRPWARKQALIVTDGKSNGAPNAGWKSAFAAYLLKNTGVELFALYVGDPDDDDFLEIRSYVSLPKVDHVFAVDSVMSLTYFVATIGELHNRICES